MVYRDPDIQAMKITYDHLVNHISYIKRRVTEKTVKNCKGTLKRTKIIESVDKSDSSGSDVDPDEELETEELTSRETNILEAQQQIFSIAAVSSLQLRTYDDVVRYCEQFNSNRECRTQKRREIRRERIETVKNVRLFEITRRKSIIRKRILQFLILRNFLKQD